METSSSVLQKTWSYIQQVYQEVRASVFPSSRITEGEQSILGATVMWSHLCQSNQHLCLPLNPQTACPQIAFLPQVEPTQPFIL